MTSGSRSGAVGGTAIHIAIGKIQEKAKKIAAHLPEAAPEDIVAEGGRYFVRGAPDRSKGFSVISLAAYLAHNYPKDLEPGLEAKGFYDPSNFTFPFGAQIAVVETKRETGEVKILKYVAVDDIGNVIIPPSMNSSSRCTPPRLPRSRKRYASLTTRRSGARQNWGPLRAGPFFPLNSILRRTYDDIGAGTGSQCRRGERTLRLA